MIRPAWPSDVPAIVGLMADYWPELPAEKAPFAPRDAAVSADRWIKDEICFVSEVRGEVTGVAAGVISNSFYNFSFRAATLLLWYVVPGHRNGTGGNLLDAFETEAWRRGAQQVIAGYVARRRDPAMDRLLKRRGYVLSDMCYLKEPG